MVGCQPQDTDTQTVISLVSVPLHWQWLHPIRISWNYCHSTPETRSCVVEQRCQSMKTEVNPESNPSWPLLVKLNLSPFDHSRAAFLRANLLKYGIIVSQCSVGVCHCFIRSTKGTRSPMALTMVAPKIGQSWPMAAHLQAAAHSTNRETRVIS